MSFHTSNTIILEEQLVVKKRIDGVDLNTDMYVVEIKTYVYEGFSFHLESSIVVFKTIGKFVFFENESRIPPFLRFLGGEVSIDKPETILERKRMIVEGVLGDSAGNYIV
jgi:hypothetical protein